MPGIELIILYILLGSFIGIMAGLLGVGGGGILVPLLTMIFAYQVMIAEHVVHVALGTTFACMMISSLSSISAHAAKENVLWKIFYGIAPGVILGAFLTTRLAPYIHSTYIAFFFAGFMMLVAAQMFLNLQPKKSSRPMTTRGMFLTGIVIGSISAIAAVGGGFLVVTYLTYKNIPMKKAIGTSAAIGLPIAISATVGYLLNDGPEALNIPYMLGFIYLPAFVAISIASTITAPIGAHYAQHLPDKHLKKIFAILCVALSIKMVQSLLP